MQKSRRDFAKKTAIVAAGAAVAGSATAVMAGTSVDNVDSLSNGVVVGSSNKKKRLLTRKMKRGQNITKTRYKKEQEYVSKYI